MFDVVAGEGQYRQFTRRVFRLADAFRLFVVGRLYSDDVDDVLLAAAARWKTFLGSVFASGILYYYYYILSKYIIF